MLQLGDADGAFAIYDRSVRPAEAQSPPLFTLADAASFLWRMALYGQKVKGEDWQEVATLATDSFPNAGLAFADVHTALSLAATGRNPALQQRIDALASMAAEERLSAGPVVAALCRGTAAFARGSYDDCIADLGPALTEMARIGGSHAQRDVIEDTLIAACRRAGRDDEAEAATMARAKARAPHLNEKWLERLPAAA
jgi:hypothetical protein